jgi:hypothetical protein
MAKNGRSTQIFTRMKMAVSFDPLNNPSKFKGKKHK